MTETEVWYLAREAFRGGMDEGRLALEMPSLVRFAEAIAAKEQKRALSVVCDECAAALEGDYKHG